MIAYLHHGAATLRKLSEFLGDAIRQKRKIIGLTQDELGEACGLSRTAIAKLERGETWPRIENIEQIAKKLGCHPIDLFQITPPKLNIDKDVQDAIRSEVESALKKLGHTKKTT